MAHIKFQQLKTGAGFLVAGQVIQAAVGFGVNLVLVRMLLPEEFGHFALIVAAAALLYSVLSLRIETMIIRAPDAHLNEKTKIRYFCGSLLETLVSSGFLVLWAVCSGNNGVFEIALIAALGIRHWANQNKAFFERSMPYRELALMETSTATLSHLFALALVLMGVGETVLYYREYFLTLAGLLGLWMIGGLTWLPIRKLSRDDIKSLFAEARGMWLDAVLENSFNRVVILVVGLLGGERAAGFFFQAQSLASIPQRVLGPIVTRVAGNWFGRTEDWVVRKKGRDKLIAYITVPLIILSVACYYLADPIVPWLFGETWRPSAGPLAAMSGMIASLSLFEVLKSYCWTARRIRWLLAGRFAQYLGGAAVVGATLTHGVSVGVSLAWGLSGAYTAAVVSVFILLKLTERDW